MTELDSYDRPQALPEALALRAQDGMRVVAGCTDVFPATERKALSGKVLDITGIAELRGISRSADGLRIGATTTWSDLVRADLPPALRSLQLAGREVGAVQIQNRGTLAGNLCNASPAADGVPPLLCVNAEVELASVRGTRRIGLDAFLHGPRDTALAPDEILVAVHVPASALAGQGHFVKLGARAYLVISIAMVAARIVVQDGLLSEVAVSVGACGPVATRLAALEARLTGQPVAALDTITDAEIAEVLRPIDDVRADAGYRAQSAAELVRRCALACVEGVPA